MMSYRPFAKKARVILTEHDYLAARAVLLASAKTALAREDEARVEALLRELAYYDSNPAKMDSRPTTGFAAHRSVARFGEDEGPRRRWSDRPSER